MVTTTIINSGGQSTVATFTFRLVTAFLVLILIVSCSQEIADGETKTESSQPEEEPVEETVNGSSVEETEEPSAPENPEELSPETNETNIPPLPSSASTGKTHYVNLIEGGFEDLKITVKVGDTVVWQNIREGRYNQALILGTQKCSKAKSSFFYPGEVYKYTFLEPMTCNIVDGIYTTQSMKVIVE